MPQPQGGTRPRSFLAASTAPEAAAKALVVCPDGKAKEPGSGTSRRAWGRTAKGLGRAVASLISTEAAKPIANATSPARAILRPVFLPNAAIAPRSAIHTTPRLPLVLSVGIARSRRGCVHDPLMRWKSGRSAPAR
jgi:hypothetical protein